jgi:hypothetical protein
MECCIFDPTASELEKGLSVRRFVAIPLEGKKAEATGSSRMAAIASGWVVLNIYRVP